MKRLLISSLFFAALGAMVYPSPGLSQGYYGLKDTAGAIGYTEREREIEPLVARVVAAVLALTAIVFFGLMCYAGLRWMTARGNEELREKAIHTLQAATIGFVIITASYAITSLFLGKLITGGGGL